MNRIFEKFFLCSFAVMSFNVNACSPINAHPVFFRENSSIIDGKQLQMLSAWTAEMKYKYPAREMIESSVTVEPTERNNIQLGWSRELAVRLALVEFDFTAPIFISADEILVQRPRPEGTAGGIPTRSVWISFLPGCPHECPCQKSWQANKTDISH